MPLDLPVEPRDLRAFAVVEEATTVDSEGWWILIQTFPSRNPFFWGFQKMVGPLNMGLMSYKQTKLNSGIQSLFEEKQLG